MKTAFKLIFGLFELPHFLIEGSGGLTGQFAFIAITLIIIYGFILFPLYMGIGVIYMILVHYGRKLIKKWDAKERSNNFTAYLNRDKK